VIMKLRCIHRKRKRMERFGPTGGHATQTSTPAAAAPATAAISEAEAEKRAARAARFANAAK
jgi:hypothetical protein